MLTSNALHILCFGDSLTAGYSQSGALYHPYGYALKSALEKAYPSANITVDVQGQNGDQAMSPPGFMLPRLKGLYQASNTQLPYNWAVILGGTNDLNQTRDANQILASLIYLWNIPLDHSTKVLSLTVPECGDCAARTGEQRSLLNADILGHSVDNFHTFDLNTAVPYWNLTEEKRKRIWDDTVHFTAAGYNLVGTLVAARLVEFIGPSADANSGVSRGELKKKFVLYSMPVVVVLVSFSL